MNEDDAAICKLPSFLIYLVIFKTYQIQIMWLNTYDTVRGIGYDEHTE